MVLACSALEVPIQVSKLKLTTPFYSTVFSMFLNFPKVFFLLGSPVFLNSSSSLIMAV